MPSSFRPGVFGFWMTCTSLSSRPGSQQLEGRLCIPKHRTCCRCFRLEAIASRLEAIDSRLEAIRTLTYRIAGCFIRPQGTTTWRRCAAWRINTSRRRVSRPGLRWDTTWDGAWMTRPVTRGGGGRLRAGSDSVHFYAFLALAKLRQFDCNFR